MEEFFKGMTSLALAIVGGIFTIIIVTILVLGILFGMCIT